MADIEPPTKRVCLVAPKGSVHNNPFRMLPPEVMTNIKAMKSDKHPPRPTALLIKELTFVREDDHLMVSAHPRQGVNFLKRQLFIGGHPSEEYEAVFETNLFDVYSRFTPDERCGVELGRVLLDEEVHYRRLRGNPAMSGTRELYDAWRRAEVARMEDDGVL